VHQQERRPLAAMHRHDARARGLDLGAGEAFHHGNPLSQSLRGAEGDEAISTIPTARDCFGVLRTPRNDDALYAFYSTLVPLALIGAAHFSISLLTKPPRYCGVARSSDTITAPRPSRRCLTAGVCMAASAASLSFLTIASGAPFGRKIAFHV